MLEGDLGHACRTWSHSSLGRLWGLPVVHDVILTSEVMWYVCGQLGRARGFFLFVVGRSNHLCPVAGSGFRPPFPASLDARWF